MLGLKGLLVGVAIAAGLSGAAEAAVRYTFTGVATVGTGAFGGASQPVSGGFSVVLPDFVTSPQFVGSTGTPADYCTASVGTFCYAFLSPETNPFFSTYGPGDKVVLRSNSPGTVNEAVYNFADNAFNGFGTFLSTGTNVGTLIVADAAAVPEPATWGMMLVGFGLLGGALRRRTASLIEVAPIRIKMR